MAIGASSSEAFWLYAIAHKENGRFSKIEEHGINTA